MVPDWDSPVAFPCDVTTTYLLADPRNWAVARVRNPELRCGVPRLAAEMPIAPQTSQNASVLISKQVGDPRQPMRAIWVLSDALFEKDKIPNYKLNNK